MSTSDIYPLGLITTQKITRVNSVLSDAFESGVTATRSLWADKNFKRQVQLQHNSLTPAEYRYLRSFFEQRNGTFDQFWFRDNIGRSGNILCRFAENLSEQHNGFLYDIGVKLNEVSPLRSLPEFDELAAAAGFTPVLWYDANREFDLLNAGVTSGDPNQSVWDATIAANYPAAWLAGADPDLSQTRHSQYQTYHFTSGNIAKTTANLAEISGAQPACTIFVITRSATNASKRVLFALGAMGSGKALGLALAADNHLEPWLGGTETWSAARVTNAGLSTPQSVALVWTGSSNSVTLYNNAASIGTDSNTRSLTAGPFAFGSAIDGTLGAVDTHVSHVLIFAAALSLAQIKAVHNLLGYQYGLAIVP